MTLTVREALKIGAFKECKLLAGEKGLGRKVSYISSMEVPNVKIWAVNKQLLITTAYSIKNEPSRLKEILCDLSAAGASGLGIKTKFIGQIPQTIIKLADKLHMPLIEIAEPIQFIDLIVPIMRVIINEQNSRLEFSERIYTKLIELNLSEGGLTNIADFIFNLLGTPCFILNEQLSIVSTNSANQLISETLKNFAQTYEQELIKFSEENKLLKTITPSAKEMFVIRKVLIKDKLCGYIVLFINKKLDETSLIVVEHAATAAALEFSKSQALKKQMVIIENNFYIDLITENVKNEEEAYQRASNLKWPKLPLTLVLFNIDHFDTITKEEDEATIFQLKDNISKIIAQGFKPLKKPIAILINSDSFCCVLTDEYTKKELSIVIKNTLQAVLVQTSLNLTAGISRGIEKYTDLKPADKDATEAILICRRENKTDKFVFSDDIKLEKALLTVKNNPVIREFTNSTIGELIKYDQVNNSRLTDTLEELIKCMGIRTTTAKHLYIHRNTLTQRIKRIEEITGHDLSRNNDLLSLGIAIKMQKLFK